MPLALYFSPSFSRSLKHLTPEQRKVVGLILEALEVYYSTGCDLHQTQKIAVQFFYKQLRKPYYEAGVESNIRVVLIKEEGKYIALLAGNHDQIRKFLANS